MSNREQFPGWYIDPANPAGERFWNGMSWTDQTRSAPTLDDYIGPIEPMLLQILDEADAALPSPTGGREGLELLLGELNQQS